MKTSTLLKAALLSGTAVTLAACGGGGGGASASSTPEVVPLSSQFGAGFSADYMASANTEPVVPVAGDIIALTLTAEPLPIH